MRKDNELWCGGEQQAEIASLQGELSVERQHSREQAERIAVLADQAQRLQFAQMSPQMIDGTKAQEGQDPHVEEDPATAKRSWWQSLSRRT